MNSNHQRRISFTRIRKTAIAYRQLSSDSSLLPGISSDDRVLRDLEQSDSGKKIEVCLALIEWHRLSHLVCNVDAVLAVLAEQLTRYGGAILFKQVIKQEYTKENLIDLIDWLVRYVGKQASIGLEHLYTTNQRRSKHTFLSAISPTSILLHYLSSSTELPSDYCQVTALDSYIGACIDNDVAGLVEHCFHFRSIVSLHTRIHLLQYEMQWRRKQKELESIFNPCAQFASVPRNHFGRMILSVRRDHIMEDSFILVDADTHEEALFNGISVQFTDEDGEDAGGLIKEWLLLLSRILVPRSFRLKEEDNCQRYTVQAHCISKETELLGVILGISLMHNVAVDLPLAHYIYRYLINGTISVNLFDLEEVQPNVAKGLHDMLVWSDEDFTKRLSANFCYVCDDGIIIPLVKEGEKNPVTFSNRETFAERLCQTRLVEERIETLEAIKAGFDRVWSGIMAVQLFTENEIANLICGQEIECSVDYLRNHTTVEYQGSKGRAFVDLFWKVFETADEPDFINQLLLFVTANRRIPLHSSKAIFHILVLQGEEFSSRLPTASTCTNTLFLPIYESIDVLRNRLCTAFRLGIYGFGLK